MIRIIKDPTYQITLSATASLALAANVPTIHPSRAPAKPKMPYFNDTFVLGGGSILVFRAYDNYGDGTQDGWRDPVATPSVSVAQLGSKNSTTLKLAPLFRYQAPSLTPYIYGSISLGYDQYAQYYGTIKCKDSNVMQH